MISELRKESADRVMPGLARTRLGLRHRPILASFTVQGEDLYNRLANDSSQKLPTLGLGLSDPRSSGFLYRLCHPSDLRRFPLDSLGGGPRPSFWLGIRFQRSFYVHPQWRRDGARPLVI